MYNVAVFSGWYLWFGKGQLDGVHDVDVKGISCESASPLNWRPSKSVTEISEMPEVPRVSRGRVFLNLNWLLKHDNPKMP